MIEEAAGVSAQALERRLKELGVRPVYSKRPSEEGRPTKARRPSNEVAILGPYILTKAARKAISYCAEYLHLNRPITSTRRA